MAEVVFNKAHETFKHFKRSEWAVGLSTVFMRDSAKRCLDSLLAKQSHDSAAKIQSYMKG